MAEGETVLLAIIAFIFPPAAVAFISGCGVDLCLNILLTLLGWLPGCIHAFWLILKRAEANEKYGYKNWTYMGNGRFRALQGQAPPPGQPPPPQPQPYTQPQPPPAGYYAPPPAPPGQKVEAGYAPPPSQVPAGQQQK